MSDKELLELAAKAAGIQADKSKTNGGPTPNDGFDAAGNMVRDWHNGTVWNPLTDDGDALRLAVKLGIYIQPFTEACTPSVFARGLNHLDTEQVIPLGDDPCAATRRAVVRAAAEIGKTIVG